jgi:hypothetical protein
MREERNISHKNARTSGFNEYRSFYTQSLLNVTRYFVLFAMLKDNLKASREIISYARILYTSYASKTW